LRLKKDRRSFLQMGSLGLSALALNPLIAKSAHKVIQQPMVVSTWDAGIRANQAAWQILQNKGRALDAVEKGVMVTEAERSCCVGLGANPDREGKVTLDACIMDDQFNCGSVVFLERIKHPIQVARLVMEKTPHVMLAGEGAQQFAVSQGIPLEKQELSVEAKKEYENWLKKSEYKPVINIENKNIPAPQKLSDGSFNHDTIGMIAMDAAGNLSGSCTTSGMGFKMRGRIGDSPIIGAGLYVDNEVGAAVATGQGEDIIRIAGAHSTISYMQQGFSPEVACKKVLERLLKIKGTKAKDIQAAIIAISKNGEVGAYALQKGFSYAVCDGEGKNRLIEAKYLI
jgi:N4-(beta-N-acetylglucosaminyl)-L-asparaginase